METFGRRKKSAIFEKLEKTGSAARRHHAQDRCHLAADHMINYFQSVVGHSGFMANEYLFEEALATPLDGQPIFFLRRLHLKAKYLPANAWTARRTC
ncbi:hypothetical protein R1flu_015336 [Riccia fluitans]|uniref:Uncharacterized protein n=1 Tax=Riccia fluitans TaxID=41844 RepID=A0ABD1YJ03_9MARC